MRMQRGCDILAQADHYDHLIVNDDIDQAFSELEAVLKDRLQRQRDRIGKIIEGQLTEIGGPRKGGGWR